MPMPSLHRTVQAFGRQLFIMSRPDARQARGLPIKTHS